MIIRLYIALLILLLLLSPTVQQAIALGINSRFSFELLF